MGPIWDDAAELAELHDVTMTDLVRVAIERLLASPDVRDALAAGKTRAPRVTTPTVPPTP